MLKRPSPSLARLLAVAVEKLTRHLMPVSQASRPVGGPVVFRHYL